MRAFGVLGLAALAGTVASSCSAPPRAEADARPAPRAARQLPAAQIAQIAQIGFGRHAGFVTCQPPGCPVVTPKTLAAEVPFPPPKAPEPRRVEPGSSLDRHETLLPGPAPAWPRSPPVATPGQGPEAASISQEVIVHFGFGSAALTPAARGLIDQAAGGLHDARRIAISGRTDSVGPARVNESLARARAQAVLDHLRERHPHLARAATLDAKGGCCFTAANDTPLGRARNRRVEIVFDGVERDGDGL